MCHFFPFGVETVGGVLKSLIQLWDPPPLLARSLRERKVFLSFVFLPSPTEWCKIKLIQCFPTPALDFVILIFPSSSIIARAILSVFFFLFGGLVYRVRISPLLPCESAESVRSFDPFQFDAAAIVSPILGRIRTRASFASFAPSTPLDSSEIFPSLNDVYYAVDFCLHRSASFPFIFFSDLFSDTYRTPFSAAGDYK